MTWWMWVIVVVPAVIGAVFGIVDSSPGNRAGAATGFFIGWAFIGLAAVGIIWGIKYAVVYYPTEACRQATQAMGRDYRWSFHTGCMVEDGDRFIPLGSFARNEESSR